MKLTQILFCSFFLSFQTYAQLPRLLITTDIGGDPDDQQSMVRLLCYSNEFELEGLIASASGTPGELKEEVIKPHLIGEMVDAYAKVEKSLKRHSPDYPEASYLRSIIKKGNPHRGWENVGEDHDTEASEWIIRCVDKNDPRPLNIAIWGGQTDLAQALWKVKHSRTPEEYQSFVSKVRIYDIMDQDRIFSKMWETFPGMFYILNRAPEGQDKRNAVFRGMYLGGNEDITSMDWIKTNVLEGHGPLGALYPTKTWTAPNPHGVMKEGDTPSWFYFLSNGLNMPDHPEYGGWGGRFLLGVEDYYNDATDTVDGEANSRATLFRWRDDFQHDFAARMDWCVNDFEGANHAPVAIVNGHSDKEPLVLDAESQKTIVLDASPSYDPDENELTYEWMIYPEAGDFNGEIELKTNGSKATLVTPILGDGDTLHIILKVKDSGSPNLSAYKRIVLIGSL